MFHLALGMDGLASSKVSILGHNEDNRSIMGSLGHSSTLSKLEPRERGISNTSNVNRSVFNMFQDANISAKEAAIGTTINKGTFNVAPFMLADVVGDVHTAIDDTIKGNFISLRGIGGRPLGGIGHHVAEHGPRGLRSLRGCRRLLRRSRVARLLGLVDKNGGGRAANGGSSISSGLGGSGMGRSSAAGLVTLPVDGHSFFMAHVGPAVRGDVGWTRERRAALTALATTLIGSTALGAA